MSRVNVWSFVISHNIIKDMSKGCGLWNGDAVAWYNFNDNLYGNIEVFTPSSCSLPGRNRLSVIAVKQSI